MKKLFTLSVLGAAAVLALSSCQKTDAAFTSEDSGAVSTILCKATASIAGSEGTKVEFTAREGNKSKVLWAPENERLAVCEFLDGKWRGNVDSVQRVYTGDIYTVSEDRSKAEFNYELDNSGTASRYDYVAIYPGSAMRTHADKSKKDKLCQDIAFQTGSAQVPTATSPDTAMCVMAAKQLGLTKRSSELAFQFKHIAAYGKLTITGLPLDEGETVSEIKIISSSSHNLLGRFSYYPDNDSLAIVNGQVSSLAINPKNIEIKSNTPFEVWFACAPNTFAAGEELTISIKTSAKTVNASITLAKELSLASGKVTTISLDASKYLTKDPDLILTFDLSTCPASLDSVKSAIPDGEYDFVANDAKTYKMSFYNQAKTAPSYSDNGYLVLNCPDYLGTPAIEGYSLRYLTFTQQASKPKSGNRKTSMTTKTYVGSLDASYYDASIEGDGASVITNDIKDYTFTIKPGVRKAGSRYYLVCGSKGIGISKLVLAYDKVK